MAVAHEHLTIHFEDAGDGWVLARIAECPEAISQGRTHEEAEANVRAAYRDLTDPRSRPGLLGRLRIAAAGVVRRLPTVG